MDSIAELLERNAGDPRIRLELGQEILNAFAFQPLPSDSTVLTQFCDVMVQWLNGSNFKVALLALEIIDVALGVSGDLLAPYLLENCTTVMERLGDNKEQVRLQALELIIKFMAVPHSSPQLVFERLMQGFTHKQWLVRVGVCQVLQQVLRTFGAGSLQLSKMSPLVCKLVSDPASQVRDTASDTLVDMYVFTGDRLAYDIQKRRMLPESKLSAIFSRFEDAKRQGLVSANGEPLPENTTADNAPPIFKTPARPPPVASTGSRSRTGIRKPDQEEKKDQDKMSSGGASKRASSVPAVKRLQVSTRQGSSGAGAVNEDSFYAAFEDCPKIQLFSAKDLTAMMENLRELLSDPNNDWDKRVDALKKFRSVVFAGATDYDEFYSELKLLEVPFQLSVKDLRSQVVREACITLAACCEFIIQMISTWESHALERNVTLISEAIRQGLSDADPDARTLSRKGFHSFSEQFADQADVLFNSLDLSKQKQLLGELSQSTSSGSIGAFRRSSQENINRYGSHQRAAYYGGGRSTSDIDTGAARRAMQRHSGLGTKNKPPLQPMNSLPRPGRLVMSGTPRYSATTTSPSAATSSDSRSTARTPSKSVSQPGSRSGSPTSRLPTSVRKPRPTVPARSHGGSREQSPNRSGLAGPRRYSTDAASPSGVAQKYLTHSRDMERALYDALQNQRGVGRGEDNDMSETSSVCSERSLNRFESAELTEALRCCSSTQWGERKDGLSTLQSYFRANRQFSHSELRRICEVFTRMFVDPHNKTFSLFLDTLVEFLAGYRSELCDWLYVLLTRLLMKLGADLLASVQNKLQKTLEVVRESFDYGLQFQTLIRYIMDPSQTPSLKVKGALLSYMCDLIHSMDPVSFVNTADTRQAVYKVIHWTMEPKSSEVRKASSNVVVALFGLNASEFTAMQNTFPKSYQESVSKLLRSQLQTTDSPGALSHGNIRTRRSMSPSFTGLNGSGFSFDMDNVHDRLRETSAQIQNCFSVGRVEQGKGSQDSGIVDATDGFARSDDITNGRLMETLSLSADETRQEELIGEILTELSNHNRRQAERLKAMGTLKHMSRDGSFTLWDEHFKTVLLILLETLGDKDAEIRTNALKLLKEICLSQAARFRDYAELTLLKILEVHKDREKDVTKAAEDCASVLATHLPPHVCFRVLNPVIRDEPPPTLLAGIKMITKVLEQLTPEEVEQILPDVVPGIVQSYENSDSGVRKASVLCLVALHNSIGEQLQPFLGSLNTSKVGGHP